MSGSPNSPSSSTGPISEGDALAIAGAVAFVIILVSSTIGWGLWMAYRTTKILSASTQTRMAQRVPSSRAGSSVSEMSTLEMGTSFLKGDSGNDWEPSRLPYLQSQNSELPTCLPTLPERAYVSGWVPFPQSVPRCQTLDAVKSPMMIAHSTSDLCGVDVVLGSSKSTAPQPKGAQNLLSPQLSLINFDEGDNAQPAAPPAPWSGLGLSLIDIGAATDDVTVPIRSDTVQDAPLQVEVSLLDSTSGTKLAGHVSLDPVPVPLQLLSPLMTPILPTLVLTSAPFKPTPDIQEESDPVSQLASPPATPTLLLTGPSIHCGLDASVESLEDRDVDEELESWSDVFGFQEYEDDGDLLDRVSCRLLEDFPSPPESPVQRSVFDIPQNASTDSESHPEPSVPGGTVTSSSATDYDQIVDKVEDKVEEAPFDYAAFRERLATFLKDVSNQKINDPTDTVKDNCKNVSATISHFPTSSSSPHFDYEKLRARRRSQTLLSHSPVPQAASVRVAPRPLPLPAEFPPLLSRAVDRPKCL